MESFAGVRVSDLVTFLAVQRTRSVTAAARELKVTPSQVSKAIVRLEGHLKARLLTRSVRGVKLTTAGQDIVPAVAGAIDVMRNLHARAKATNPVELTIAGPSYLITYAMPAIARNNPSLQLRGVELSPAGVRAQLGEDAFDMAFAVGAVQGVGASWTSDRIGTQRTVLFGSPEVARRLHPFPAAVSRVRKIPFVAPMLAGPTLSPLDDSCPLPRRERQVAHQSQTIGAALELAAQTGTLVFGPRIAGHRMIEAGALVEIPVQGWEVVEDLFLLCALDRVLDRVRRSARDALRALADIA